jgi:hypothetical protein
MFDIRVKSDIAESEVLEMAERVFGYNRGESKLGLEEEFVPPKPNRSRSKDGAPEAKTGRATSIYAAFGIGDAGKRGGRRTSTPAGAFTSRSGSKGSGKAPTGRRKEADIWRGEEGSGCETSSEYYQGTVVVLPGSQPQNLNQIAKLGPNIGRKGQKTLISN